MTRKPCAGIAERDGVTEGLVAIFKTVELGRSFSVVSNRERGLLDLKAGPRRCLHYYFYLMHPDFGLMHLHLESWLPFTMHVCLNGREWLARQMTQAGLSYVKSANCFLRVANVARAQEFLHEQVRYDWSGQLSALAGLVNPMPRILHATRPPEYYWSLNESEWATDLMFKTPETLGRLYPRLVRHSIETLSCEYALRFLGRKEPAHCPTAEVIVERRKRAEGVCVKHRVNRNVVKMYDKEQSVLRVETVVNNAEDFKVRRTTENAPNGPKTLRKMRKGVVDVPVRVEVSQASNERYLEALSSVEAGTPLRELADPVCQPTQWRGRRVRALQPMDPQEARLLEAVSRGEYVVNGFRNRDLRLHLYPGEATTPAEAKKRSAAVTRRLRLLRAHGLIEKVEGSHLYRVSDRGRLIMTALLASRIADAAKLIDAA